jgi:hypothetical protein
MVQSKVKSVSKSKSCYYRRPVSQYVPALSPPGIEGVPSEKTQFYIRNCTLRRNPWFHHWEGRMRSMQCNVKPGYQLSICSGTMENHGKPWSSWPVAGPLRCKPTSSQQSSIKYASPNTSPYQCFFFFFSCFLFFFPFFFSFLWKHLQIFLQKFHLHLNISAYNLQARTVRKHCSLFYCCKIECGSDWPATAVLYRVITAIAGYIVACLAVVI